MLDFANNVRLAEKGETHVFFVGQAGFIIKSKTGQLLGIDLYLSDCVERVEGHVGFKRLLPHILGAKELLFDILITTHYHRDHFDIDTLPKLMDNGITQLLSTYDCKTDIEALEIDTDRVSFVKTGDYIISGDFDFDFVSCDHGNGAPDAVGVIVSVDGKKIYITGDTCLHREWSEVLPHNLDVMIAPINGAYGNLNEKECVEYSELLKPKLTIPCHYGMFASHGGNPGVFYNLMSKNNLPFHFMSMGEQYTIY